MTDFQESEAAQALREVVTSVSADLCVMFADGVATKERAVTLLAAHDAALDAYARRVWADAVAALPCWGIGWKPLEVDGVLTWEMRSGFGAQCTRAGYPACPSCAARASGTEEE
jgi:hypothetical protein